MHALLARQWLAGDAANELARLCEQAWHALAGAGGVEEAVPAIYWYEEVAILSRAALAGLPAGSPMARHKGTIPLALQH